MENNQIDLENNYKMNLRVFENYAPQIYKRLMLKSNDAYCLELFENELNVSKNGNLIYPKGFVYEYFKHLLSEYYKRDSQNIFQYKLPIYSKDESIKYLTKKSIHAEYNVALYELYISIFNKKPILNSPNHNYIHTFTSFGIGLGYHIPELIKKYNIKNFVLLDVDIEMLRVSLFTIKWEEIFLYVTQKNKNRSMTILIEEGQETIDRQYGRYLSDYNSMGYYNLWQMTSYNDDILNQRVSSIIKNMDMYGGAYLGFYDDEKWSLQHTLYNLRKSIPILAKNDLKVDQDKHVFIVANGPSLDNYIDVIKGNREDVILIAAGSALGSLYKYDIKPDFLIQVERDVYTYVGTLEFAPPEYLKDIKIIGSNVVHPKLFSLFNKKYMFCKNNDAGTFAIQTHLSTQFEAIANAGPTVSNAALALALYFGFKNISLFGMDFGFKSNDQHHSKNSIYHNEDSKFFVEEHTDNLQVKGVDGEVVFTDVLYNDSRKLLERAIYLAKLNENINIYNYSDGAFIEHAINSNSVSIDNNTISKDAQDNKITLKTIEKQFTNNYKEIEINYKDIIQKMDILIDKIKEINSHTLTTYDFLNIQVEIQNVFNNEFVLYPYIKIMLRGTLSSFLGAIYTYSSSHKPNKNISLFIYKSLEIVHKAFVVIRNDIEIIEKDLESTFS